MTSTVKTCSCTLEDGSPIVLIPLGTAFDPNAFESQEMALAALQDEAHCTNILPACCQRVTEVVDGDVLYDIVGTEPQNNKDACLLPLSQRVDLVLGAAPGTMVGDFSHPTNR